MPKELRHYYKKKLTQSMNNISINKVSLFIASLSIGIFLSGCKSAKIETETPTEEETEVVAEAKYSMLPDMFHAYWIYKRNMISEN